MSQPTPAIGIYTDSSGTYYEATRQGKPPQWYLKKLRNCHGVAYMPIPPWPHESFPRDVKNQVFRLLTTPS